MTEKNTHTYVHGYQYVGHHEWRTAENSVAYLLPPLQELAKQKPDLKLLDVGAGSGTITASLVKYMPSGHITAADLSDEVLSKARAFAKDAGVDKQITTRVVSVYELVDTFGENSFDVVHASQMLVHLDDPVRALSQMYAVCKPGGIVASRDADLRTILAFPETPGLKRFSEAVIKTHAGTVDAALHQIRWGLKAGVKREQMTWTIGTYYHSIPPERKMWSEAMTSRLVEGSWRKVFLERGVADEAAIEEMIQAWRDWAETEDGTTGSMHGELLIRK